MQRFDLEIINIMNNDGSLNAAAGAYEGLDRFDARKKLWADIEVRPLLDHWLLSSRHHSMNMACRMLRGMQASMRKPVSQECDTTWGLGQADAVTRPKAPPGPAGGRPGDQGGALHDARAALAAGGRGHRAARAEAVVRVHAAAGAACPQGEATPHILPLWVGMQERPSSRLCGSSGLCPCGRWRSTPSR